MYHAFEIDKHAIAVSRYQYPDIEHHGDVLDADFYKFADMGIDLVIGGSPCTFWSIAKVDREIDKNGMGWKLFMRFVEAVRQIKPRYFLLENVASMPGNIKSYISEELGCEPVLINSALVSAQSRKRLYWTNIGGDLGIRQPADKGILLKDIINNEVDKKRKTVSEPITFTNKSKTIVSTLLYENAQSMLKRKKMGLLIANKVDNCSDICAPLRIGIFGNGYLGDRIYSIKGKSVSMKSQGGGRGALTGLYKIDLPDGDYVIRKLTPLEAERCQTLSDNYTAWGIDDKGKTVKISTIQRYRTIGNGFTADVIAHILSYINNGGFFNERVF